MKDEDEARGLSICLYLWLILGEILCALCPTAPICTRQATESMQIDRMGRPSENGRGNIDEMKYGLLVLVYEDDGSAVVVTTPI